MNRNIIILLVLLMAGIACYLLVINKPWTTFKGELKDFAIHDTASITKIFLADKTGRTVLLQKQPDQTWLVNGMYKADQKKIDLLKQTMKQVQVRNPLAESEFNTVVARMAANAVKAEFFNEDKLIKTIYVGGQTNDNTGTFMMIEGASTPYVTHISGFVGYLTPRFNTEAIRWKTKEVFVLPAEDISTISISYPQDISASFIIDNTGTTPVLKDSNNRIHSADIGFLKYYTASFSNIYFEGYVEDIKPIQNDSIRTTPVYCIMEVKQKSTGKAIRLQIHKKGVNRRSTQQFDEEGNKLTIDRDKYFAFLNNEQDVVYIQDYVFRNLFKTLADFKATLRPTP
jgi:hypothetical protein